MFSYNERLKVFDLYGTATDEVCYAQKRLGPDVVAYNRNYVGQPDKMVQYAIEQAQRINKPVAIFLSGQVTGLFKITPQITSADAFYDHLVKDQKMLRWDKPIEQQRAEERTLAKFMAGPQKDMS